MLTHRGARLKSGLTKYDAELNDISDYIHAATCPCTRPTHPLTRSHYTPRRHFTGPTSS